MRFAPLGSKLTPGTLNKVNRRPWSILISGSTSIYHTFGSLPINFNRLTYNVDSVQPWLCSCGWSLHDYWNMSTDYRHIDNYFRLVIVVVSLCCTQQSWAPNIDCCALVIWPWSVTLTLTCDLDHKAMYQWCKTRYWVLDLDCWQSCSNKLARALKLLQSCLTNGHHLPHWAKLETGTHANGWTDAIKYIISLLRGR